MEQIDRRPSSARDERREPSSRNQKPTAPSSPRRILRQYHYCWLRDGSFIAYALDRGRRARRLRGLPLAGARHRLMASPQSSTPHRARQARQADRSRRHAAGAVRSRRFDRHRRLAEFPDRRLRHVAVVACVNTSHRTGGQSVPGHLAPCTSRRTARYLAEVGNRSVLRRLGGERGLGAHRDARVRLRGTARRRRDAGGRRARRAGGVDSPRRARTCPPRRSVPKVERQRTRRRVAVVARSCLSALSTSRIRRSRTPSRRSRRISSSKVGSGATRPTPTSVAARGPC